MKSPSARPKPGDYRCYYICASPAPSNLGKKDKYAICIARSAPQCLMGVVVPRGVEPNWIAPLSYQGTGVDRTVLKHPVDAGSVSPFTDCVCCDHDHSFVRAFAGICVMRSTRRRMSQGEEICVRFSYPPPFIFRCLRRYRAFASPECFHPFDTKPVMNPLVPQSLIQLVIEYQAVVDTKSLTSIG